MYTHEVCRPDGGPLERNHMKDMVQRNTLESVALTKIAKHLETEKRAFVRQSTRDEEEMKHLLHRLQLKQQTNLQDDDSGTDDETHADEKDDNDDKSEVINPYPITIIPKYGGSVNSTKLTSSQSKIGTRYKQPRRKSDEYDELHDSVSLMTSSAVSISDAQTNTDDVNSEWLASPNAISSIRRLRKTVPEQIQRKLLFRANSEVSWVSDNSSSPSSPVPHRRSNSLKEGKKSSDDITSPRSMGHAGRRGGSLKERKHSHVIDECEHRQLLRSHSMMGKLRDDGRRFRKHLNRKPNDSETGNDSTSACLNQDEHTLPIIRKNSKKGEPKWSRKTST